MNKDIMIAMGFKAEVNQIEAGCCPICKHTIDPDSFRDELSKKEYKISGLCQECQDKIFGTED